MPYAHNPENIENLDLGWAGLGWAGLGCNAKKISINELQTASKKNGRLLAVHNFSMHKPAADIRL